MNNRPVDKLAIAVAQLNATVGDVAGNADKVRARAHRPRPTRRRSRPASRSCSLPAIRRKTSCSSRRSRRPAARRSKPSRARPADGGPAVLVGTPWVEERQALQRRRAARRRAHRGAALQGRPAELRRVRRKARVRRRADAGAHEFPRRADRRADLRGHLGTGAESECLAETGAEILLVPNGSPYRRGKSDERLSIAVARVTESRPAAGLSSTRSAARTSWCSTALRSRSMPIARWRLQLPAFAEASSPRIGGAGTAAWRCDGRADRARARRRRSRLRRLRAGPARLCREERLSGRRARPFGRHRFGAGVRRSPSMRSGRSASAASCCPTGSRREMSLDDAAAVAKALGIRYDVAADRERGGRLEEIAQAAVRRLPRDVTEENLQARARGTHPDGDVEQVRR